MAAWTALAGIVSAQAPGVRVEPGVPLTKQPEIIKQAEELLKKGKLISQDKLKQLVDAPTNQPVELLAPQTKLLTPRQVAAAARKGFVRVGWFYRCPNCDHWHINLAGGYMIDRKGAVVTCDHCIRPEHEMREGYLIAVDDENKVYPVTEIIAARKDLDAAVIRIEGTGPEPLPLQDNVAPGDSAYLFSEPFGTQGYFSSGMVNRFYWNRSEDGDATKLADAVRLRMNVSTDWAPGSSGAALLDTYGNVIGHVSTIAPMSGGRPSKDGKKAEGPAMITLHEAVPARGVMLLVKEGKKG